MGVCVKQDKVSIRKQRAKRIENLLRIIDQFDRPSQERKAEHDAHRRPDSSLRRYSSSLCASAGLPLQPAGSVPPSLRS